MKNATIVPLAGIEPVAVQWRFPFNGLTGETQILFSVSMERSGLCFSNI